MTTYLSDLTSISEFQTAIDAGYISERSHADDSTLRIYSYTPKTQYSGMWTNSTRLARGLMLRVENDLTNAVVVGRGLPKFFTVDQTESEWGRAKLVDDDEGVTVADAVELPWDAPAIVAEKLNGALGLSYFGPNGLAISTKGSFASTEAKIASRLLREKLSFDEMGYFEEIFQGSTALFEIITPERPHPINYGDTEDLFFLGSVEHATGRWIPANEAHPLVSFLKFAIAPQLAHTTLREAVDAPYRENTEGLVVTIDDEAGQHLYKVKPAEYLELRKTFYAFEAFDYAGMFTKLSSEELEGLTAETLPLPEHLPNREEQRGRLNAEILQPLAVKLTEVRAAYAELRGDGALPDRASFAKLAMSQTEVEVQLLFKAYDEERANKKDLAATVIRSFFSKRAKRAK